MTKPIPVVLYLIIFFLLTSFKLSHSTILCPEFEKEALISFKQSLEDPSNQLSSWNSSNCCNWKGVVCSNITGKGNVHKLQLQGGAGYPYSNESLEGKINHSLLKLKHLKYLDLSRNKFDGRIPSFMGSLTSLEYLNLSYNGFHGKIPPTIGNLSRLHTLDLEGNIGIWYETVLDAHTDTELWRVENSELDVDNVEWLRGLSQLEHLNMNSVNLTKASPHWMQVIDALPSLVELRLSGCSLNFNFDPPSEIFNITSLAILDLSNNNFGFFPFPKWIFRQSNLAFLDLSNNDFGGLIPAISNITKLQHIDLSGIHLNSTIPDWLYSCKDLEFVSMRLNSLQGRISNDIGNLTSLTTLLLSSNQLSGEIPRGIHNLCKLRILNLSNNMLQGEMSNMIGNLSGCFSGALMYLRLSRNHISGEIPTSLGNLSHLGTLDLRHNRLTGNLPMSLGRLSNLEYLHVGYNMMAGVVTETHLANLTKLRVFSANVNHLTLKLSPTWNPPFKLDTLELASWNFEVGSNIPSWLETQKTTLNALDLSNTGISGNIPSWLWEIDVLNISHNHLSGNVPDIIGPRRVFLSSNQFNGPLPRIGNSLYEINLAYNLFSGSISHFLCDKRDQTPELADLHLQGNKLSGEIPDCWIKWPSLSTVNLGDNNFSGSIPNSIGTLTMMKSLNLFDNKLSGQIPISIINCTFLVKLDFSGNNLVGGIPIGIGTSLSRLRFIILRSNNLRGTIPLSICHLSSLQIFDLSNNTFSGRIPSCVNNLTAMIVKRNLSDYIDEINLSEYTGGDSDDLILYNGNYIESATIVTKGRENHYDTILSLVNTIDLSNNNLSGRIPKGLTSLVQLISLNLSGNQLVGSIPNSIGDLKQLESLDLSRNVLTGEMPNSFIIMSSLSHLNLSFNNLSGRIPESTQLRGMNDSCFVGNDLCGLPLPIKCRGDDNREDAENKENNYQDDKSEMEWFYVVSSLGYAVGLSAFCTAMIFKMPRSAYYRLLECIWDKLYVYYHISCIKIMRWREHNS